MVKVITYGSYDLLHYGHTRLLERAKALGDFLIVGVTSDDFDKRRGKINLQQNLMERIEAVKATGIPDEVIVEEYEGQKIDDIKRYSIDIFTVGSDWEGKFDYLNAYCKVIYLPRTEGISSSEIREHKRSIRLGLVGDTLFLNKVWNESKFVNGINTCALCSNRPEILIESARDELHEITNDYRCFLNNVDAVYVRSIPSIHYEHIVQAIRAGKHVLCESPLTLNFKQSKELIGLAKDNNIVLMEAIKTAYSTAYSRLLLLLKSGKIGEIYSVDATCTSIRNSLDNELSEWNSIYEWGPTALLPVLQILGTDYSDFHISAHFHDETQFWDSFTKIDFVYKHAVASIKVGDGVKSEGELIISGTKGYTVVPAPWWKTDYFEIRYEDSSENKRYFYQLDGEGIRYELVAFVRAIESGKNMSYISEDVSLQISKVLESFNNRENMSII